MRRTLNAAGQRYERGAIAVEAALVFPILLLFLGFPSLYLAFYYCQYSAAQKASHDAALYLSTAPRVEVTTSGPDGNIAALTLAKNIVEREMAGTIVPNDVPVDPAIYCIYQVGGSPMTKPCTATFTKDVNHTLFQFDVSINFTYIDPLTGSDTGVLISPYAPVRYVAN
jgi:Flp pilus assembly protein TadG